jgi:hypothetical protein
MKKEILSQEKILVNGRLIEWRKLKPNFDKIGENKWRNELRKLKPEFDKIRAKSYDKALQYWDENVIPLLENHPYKHLTNSLTTNIQLQEVIKPPQSLMAWIYHKDFLTIDPLKENEGECELFNLWYLKHYSNIFYNLERRKEYILKKLNSDLPDANIFLQMEIKRSEKHLPADEEREKLPQQNSYRGITLSKKKKEIYLYVLRNDSPNWTVLDIDTVKLFAEVKFHAEYLQFLKQQLKELEEGKSKLQFKKLKWNCKPAILGFLITELANKGFIEYPLHNGEINPTGLAKICFELFDCATTKDNLVKEFNQNGKNTLSEIKKIKFRIPELTDLQ